MAQENLDLVNVLIPQDTDIELIDLEDRVLALTRNYGRRKDMEAEVEMIAAAIFTFKGGKVARWEDYAEWAAALQAAGLTEQDAHA